MNIFLPQFSMRRHFNAFWSKVVGTWIAPFLTHEAQGLSAVSLVKQFPEMPPWGPILAKGWYDRPLHGAGYGWESRYPLPYDPTSTIDVDLTSTNEAAMIVPDYCTVMEIGCGITVATTVAVLNMDFDLYPTMADKVGTVVDKLDGTNGFIKENSVAELAIGDVLYRDMSNTLNIDIDKGSSINAIVIATAPSTGQGVPYCLVVPRAMNNANVTTMVASATS